MGRGEKQSRWKHYWVLIDALCRGCIEEGERGEGKKKKTESVEKKLGYFLIDALCRGVEGEEKKRSRAKIFQGDFN